MLEIQVLKAENLPSADSNGLSDPYVVVDTVGCADITLGQTKVISKTLDPVWNQKEPFLVPFFLAKSIKFRLYDKDLIGKDELGTVLVDIFPVNFGKEQTSPVDTPLPTKGPPTLTYKINVNYGHTLPNASKKAAKGVIVYASYNPPRKNEDNIYLNFYYIEKSGRATANPETDGYLYCGQTGLTKSHYFKKANFDFGVPVVESINYTGSVTVNYVKTPKNIKGKKVVSGFELIKSKTINVSPNTAFYLSDIMENAKTSITIKTLTDSAQFQSGFQAARAAAKLILKPNVVLHQRLVLNPTKKYSLSEASKIQGIDVPSTIKIALGWDTTTDLDASVICFDKEFKCIESCNFSHREACGSALMLSGDNLTGAGSGDDEVITAKLANIPQEVKLMSICVTSFRGLPFSSVKGAFLRIIDHNSGIEIMYLNLSKKEKKTGLLFAFLARVNDDLWDLWPCIQYFNGTNPQAAAEFCSSFCTDSGYVAEMIALEY